MEEEEDPMQLPPGFRFHPTDEELITHYLSPKAADRGFTPRAVGEVDLTKCEPWDLPSRAARIGRGETREWYFFCQRDRKYPTGSRTNRATATGFWKATGKDREIFRPAGRGLLVGMKKTLVFYRGRAPRGEKTDWVMHEYRLEGSSSSSSFPHLSRSAKEEWVVCRVLHKPGAGTNIGSSSSAAAAAASTSSSLHPAAGLISYPYSYEIPAGGGGGFSALLGVENPASSPAVFFVPQQAAATARPPPPQPLHQRANYYLSYLTSGPAAEQCPSQETGLSTERNTAELESSLDEPATSGGGAGEHLDLDSIWKY